MKGKTALDALFGEFDALAVSRRADAAFLAAMREGFLHHYQRCPDYRALCDRQKFPPSRLKTLRDLPALPWLFVEVFKWYDVLSVPQKKIVITLTSSGTKGQKSHVSWDRASWDRQTRMREAIMESYGLVTGEPVNYLCFSYDPKTAGQKGAAYTHTAYTRFAPAHETFYAIHEGPDGAPAFDEEECLAALRRFAGQPYPIRITGFPAFAWKTFQALKAGGKRLRFSEESLLVHAGGWKTAADEAVTPQVYKAFVREWLGIPRSRVRDVYGFVEHGVPYITCEEGGFHVPVYAKALIRKPGTLDVLPEGEVGLLNLLTPYNMAQPTLSMVSTDYAALRSGCSCGRPGNVIELHGRAGVRKHQGCALTASELLNRTKPEARA
jgi:phenylacetate-coenzyme A ligase PaaK-like adenylate-forming protein